MNVSLLRIGRRLHSMNDNVDCDYDRHAYDSSRPRPFHRTHSRTIPINDLFSSILFSVSVQHYLGHNAPSDSAHAGAYEQSFSDEASGNSPFISCCIMYLIKGYFVVLQVTTNTISMNIFALCFFLLIVTHTNLCLFFELTARAPNVGTASTKFCNQLQFLRKYFKSTSLQLLEYTHQHMLVNMYHLNR